MADPTSLEVHTQNNSGGAARLLLEGPVCVRTLPVFESALEQTRAGQTSTVQVDLSGVPWIDATAVDVLLRWCRQLKDAHCSLRLVRPSRRVRKTLRQAEADWMIAESDPLPNAAEKTTDCAAMFGGSETILLVDDEPMIRSLGKAILERLGYRVLLAEDGECAVRAFAEQRQSIDLVILDVSMPTLSGTAALSRMRSIDPSVRAAFSSGYTELADARQRNGEYFIPKPYRPEDLAHTVRRILDTPTT